jgi:uncharacterized protein with NRDE domain
MCLVAIAWNAHPRYPLIVAGNRDEFHERPSAAAGWWPGAPDVYGGRDLVAGGSWLAVNRRGRLAVVINHPARPPSPERRASRGQLVRDWVTQAGHAATLAGFLGRVSGNADEYAGFSLIAGSLDDGLQGLITPAGDSGPHWRIGQGVSAITNSPREAPWPKAAWLEREIHKCIAADEVRAEALLEILHVSAPIAASDDDSPRAQARVRPFLCGDTYGTRASTVVIYDDAGHCHFTERRFAPAGHLDGETCDRFQVEYGS